MGAILDALSTSNPASRRARHSFIRRAVTALTIVTLVAGCGDSSHRYLANKTEHVYLKVPRDWKDVPFSDGDADRLEAKTSQATLVWRVAASTDPKATPTLADADYPLVFMAVYQLDGELNQNMSASLARVAASPTGFDPVLPKDSSQSALVEVVSYAPLAFDNMNGTRVVFRSRATADTDYQLVYDMSAAYDSHNFRLYVLQVGCNVTCYDNNSEAITKVANSWLVNP